MQKYFTRPFLISLGFLSAVALAAAGDRFINNPNQDKDIVIQVNDGGVTKEAIKVTGSTGATTIGSSSFLGAVHQIYGGLGMDANAGLSMLDIQNTDSGSGDAQMIKIIAQPTANISSGALIYVDNGGGSGNPMLKLGYDGLLTVGDATSAQSRLTVTGTNSVSDPILYAENRDATVDANNRIAQFSFDNDSDANGGYYIVFRDSDTSIVGSCVSTGAASMTCPAASDARRKKDVYDLTDALDLVSQLRPVRFSWKEDGHKDFGFIAQEVKKVLPEVVFGDETKDVSIAPMMIDYEKIVAVNTAAIKEQQAIIQELKARIEVLESR